MNESLFVAGEKVLIACSGGKDSVYLLETLFRAHERLEISLAVAHVDHGLRPESAQDACFVRERARVRRLPYFERRLDLMKKSAPRGIEALAREHRYQALEEIAIAEGFAAIATAHHRDDQIETVLLRILQGAATRHWRGMEPARRLRIDSPIRLLRPLLAIPRSSIDREMAQLGLSWREDATNRDERFLRNRVRNFLASLDPKTRDEIEESVLARQRRVHILMQLERRFRNALLRSRLRRWEQGLWLDLRELPQPPSFLLEEWVEETLRELGGQSPSGTIAAVIKLWREGRSGATALDPGGVLVCRHRDGLEFRRQIAPSRSYGPLMA